MNGRENRKYPRIDSRNLVSFVCLDESGGLIAHGMGRTLNVNETGILLETFSRIDPACTLSLAIGLKDDVVSLKGVIVRQRIGEAGRCQSGIKFLEMDAKAFEALKKFVARFKASKSTG
jgi:hypothetical protein